MYVHTVCVCGGRGCPYHAVLWRKALGTLLRLRTVIIWTQKNRYCNAAQLRHMAALPSFVAVDAIVVCVLQGHLDSWPQKCLRGCIMTTRCVLQSAQHPTPNPELYLLFRGGSCGSCQTTPPHVSHSSFFEITTLKCCKT